MASVVTYGNGLRRIEFAWAPNEPRRLLRLGRVSAKVAASWQARVEALLADKLARRPHEPELASWLGDLDEKMLARLRAIGLAEGVGTRETTLGDFLERCFASLSAKPGTRTFYGHTRRNLEERFGKARTLRSIGPADADAWRTWLVEDQKLSPATVARRVIAARTLWRRAVRWKLATENPFAGVTGGHQANETRKRFVTREEIARVLDVTQDLEMRAIIALARFAGLRTPSETFALRWGDIDWQRGTIRVTCPKLAHIESCAQRLIPLFPELKEPLLALFEAAEPGTEHVIARYRCGSNNLRTQFERLIDRAGLVAWPRLFHNLRASCQSELMREYCLPTVCRWIGNSPAVAAKHYATCIDLDADFARASVRLDPQEAQQKAQQSASAEPCPAMPAEAGNSGKPRENRHLAEAGNPGQDGSGRSDGRYRNRTPREKPGKNECSIPRRHRIRHTRRRCSDACAPS